MEKYFLKRTIQYAEYQNIEVANEEEAIDILRRSEGWKRYNNDCVIKEILKKISDDETKFESAKIIMETEK